MINGIIGGQAVTLNPILRAPSVLNAGAIFNFGAVAASTIITSLRTAADVSGTNSTTAYVNLVNVTSGKGVLLFCSFFGNNGSAACVFAITIDGVPVITGSSGSNALKCAVGCVTALDTTAQTSAVSFEAVPFYTSLKIEYKSDTAASAVGAAAKYRLT